MRVLQRIELRGAPLHAAVRRAFKEVNARFARHAHDVLEREDNRAIDKPVNHEPRVALVRFHESVVIALEKHARRRDDARLVLHGREADRRRLVGREPWHDAALHVAFVLGGKSIGCVRHGRAHAHAPILIRQRVIRCARDRTETRRQRRSRAKPQQSASGRRRGGEPRYRGLSCGHRWASLPVAAHFSTKHDVKMYCVTPRKTRLNSMTVLASGHFAC